jgi:hypothetical protein
MNADREELVQLFEAKVQSFEAPPGTRFHALLPFRDGIFRLRSKKASCRVIAGLLKQLGVTVSHNTVARYCREQSFSAAADGANRVAVRPAAPSLYKRHPAVAAESMNRRHEDKKPLHSGVDLPGRGPRIADPRNV